MESQLLEVLKVKMHVIQFVSMMMVIQIKLTKGRRDWKNSMIREFSQMLE
jgi:hypothetical protein